MKQAALIAVVWSLAGCAGQPPGDQNDICAVFGEKDRWYKYARKASLKWGVPIPTIMAFAKQESGFRARARPPRKKILGFIPGPRPASAFGFAQATDESWAAYRKSTGNWGADRDKFKDAADFIGWYNDQSNRANRIAKSDTYHLYLAYHEGHGGYRQGSYRSKQWLQDVARKVSTQAETYGQQLQRCEKRLRRPWYLRWL